MCMHMKSFYCEKKQTFTAYPSGHQRKHFKVLTTLFYNVKLVIKQNRR